MDLEEKYGPVRDADGAQAAEQEQVFALSFQNLLVNGWPAAGVMLCKWLRAAAGVLQSGCMSLEGIPAPGQSCKCFDPPGSLVYATGIWLLDPGRPCDVSNGDKH